MTTRAEEQIEQLQGVLGPDIDTNREFGQLLLDAQRAGADVWWSFWSVAELRTPVRDL